MGTKFREEDVQPRNTRALHRGTRAVTLAGIAVALMAGVPTYAYAASASPGIEHADLSPQTTAGPELLVPNAVGETALIAGTDPDTMLEFSENASLFSLEGGQSKYFETPDATWSISLREARWTEWGKWAVEVQKIADKPGAHIVTVAFDFKDATGDLYSLGVRTIGSGKASVGFYSDDPRIEMISPTYKSSRWMP